ncbi:MAG TPA: Ig-like domain-containing protein [Methylomirabilota bacterium]|nr:Ig-like domain-containing protein [Methylomirabilota bacterium]
MRCIRLTLVAAMAVLWAAACDCQTAGAATHRVEIGEYFFRPNAITIAVGDSITWTNIGSVDHDTTSGIPPTGTLWESDTIDPRGTFQFTFSSAGFYPYTCARHANRNQTGSVNVAVGPLIPPTVSITSPASPSFFVAPASFTLEATARDADGQVTSVQFFRGTNALRITNSVGIDTTAPFSTNVSQLQAGTHFFVAVARDNIGLLSTSAVVTVTVVGQGTTTVDITNFTFSPQTVVIAANAQVIWRNRDAVGHTTTGDPNSLEALCGPDSVLSATRSCTNRFRTPGIYPYYCSIHPSMVGTVVVLRVSSTPMVHLTNPAPGDVFVTNSLITLAAEASDANGITNVQFFNGVTPLGSVTTSPYILTLSNLALGNYRVVAKATDGLGLGALSGSVDFSVISPSPINLFNPTLEGGIFRFHYTADPGLTYLIEGSIAPGQPRLFEPVGTNKATSNPTIFADPEQRSARQYRVRLLP